MEVGITYNRMLCNDFTGPAHIRLNMPEVALEPKRVWHPCRRRTPSIRVRTKDESLSPKTQTFYSTQKMKELLFDRLLFDATDLLFYTFYTRQTFYSTRRPSIRHKRWKLKPIDTDLLFESEDSNSWPFSHSSKKCYILRFLLGLRWTLNRVSLSGQSAKRCWVAFGSDSEKNCKLGSSRWEKCLLRQTYFHCAPKLFHLWWS